MLTRLHANATTPPKKTRAEIQASTDPVAVLARRYGVSYQRPYDLTFAQFLEECEAMASS